MDIPTQIANLALGHLGIKNRISNIDTDRSDEALACRVYYEQTVLEVLEDFPWPFATVIVGLDKVSDNPTSEWLFAYAYPNDCLILRRILSGIRNDSLASRIKFKTPQMDGARVVLTDKAEAIAEYTKRETDVKFFTPNFASAVSFKMAFHIAPTLTGGDPFKMGERALAQYGQRLRTAEMLAGNEDIPDPERSEFNDARNPGAPFVDQGGRPSWPELG